MVFTNIQLFGLDARITKETPSSETNLQFIIDAFKSNKNTPKKKINFKINNAIIRRGKIKYDILSAPIRRGQFDPNHIDLRNLLSKLSIKALSEDSVNISIKRLGFDEQSGFSLNRLQFKFEANRQQARLSDFKIQLPHSRIEIKPIIATLPDTLSAEHFYDQTRFSLQITKSLINPSDIAAFIPVLEKINTPILISMHLTGTPNNLYFHTFDFNFGKEDIIAHSQISVKNITNPQKRDILCDPITLNASSSGLADISSKLPFLTEEQCKTISRLGTIHFTGNISNQNQNLTACGTLETDLGSVHSDISINQNNSLNTTRYSGLIESKKFNLNGLFTEGNPYGEIIFKVELDSKKAKYQAPTGKVVGGISYFEYKGYPYENIMLNGEFGDNRYNGIIEINDPNGKLRVNGLSVLKDKDSEFDLVLQARDLNVSALKLMPKYKNSKLGFNVVAKFTGNNLDNAEGLLSIDSLSFTNNDDTFRLNKFNIEAHNQNTPQSIAVTSDYINGWIEGNYKFSTLQKSLQTLLSESLPSIFPFQENQPKKTEHKKNQQPNNFKFRFTVEPNIHMAQVLELPVTFTDRAIIEGEMNSLRNTALITGTIPHLWYKKSHIEMHFISARKDSTEMALFIETNSYNKKQIRTTWSLRSKAYRDSLDLVLNWNNDTQSTFYGELNTSTHFSRTHEGNKLQIQTHINPSTLIFNDTIWQMSPSDISYCEKQIEINDFEISHAPQYILIDGIASNREEDELKIQLNDVDLDYIFGTLNIKNVTFGGNATGNLLATHLLTGAPRLSTEQFDVKDFSYNEAIFGDLHLFSMWDNDNQGILMKGFIENKEDKQTYIDGYIFPTKDSLSLSFDPDKLNIAFLRPFVSTVMSDISGIASGHIDFFGRFKALNVTGDAYVENLDFGIEYLNTRYNLSDSIHLSPTRIWFDNVTIYDKLKHTAKGSGWIEHHNFKDVSYDIAITEAQDFLSYDMTERQSRDLRFGEALGAVGGSIGLTDLDAAFHRDDGGGLSGGCGSRVGGGLFGQLHTQCGGNSLPDGLGGHRGTGNAVDGGAVGGHDLLGQLFQCSAADALGLLCAFQLAVGNGAVGIHGQGGGDSTAKAFGRAGLSHTSGGGAAAAAAGGQRDANNEAHGHGSAQFADDLLFHGSFLQRKIGLCSVHRKGHIFSRMFTKDNIFCEVLSRDFSTYFVKNDKLVSICDADGIKKSRKPTCSGRFPADGSAKAKLNA